ncbi:MAG: cytochrome c [Terriglobales bacterium]
MKILGRCLALLVLVLTTVYGLADSGAEFKTRCAPCHGARGAGDTKLGENLRVRDLGSAEVQKQSDAELTEIISKGKSKMPAYDRKLTREEINDIVKYIRTLKK